MLHFNPHALFLHNLPLSRHKKTHQMVQTKKITGSSQNLGFKTEERDLESSKNSKKEKSNMADERREKITLDDYLQ